jgi:poly(A) polymerase
VGGTVRDLLMNVDTHDLDFAVDGDGLEVARGLADHLRSAYVPLDKERRTGRVILPHKPAKGALGQLRLDVASLRGPDLASDLRDRDFTINAIAIGQGEDGLRIHDPLGGMSDIENRVLRTASPLSFTNDPVRTLRAIRMHIQFQCSLDPETRCRLLSAAPLLAGASAERVRDEWFNILVRPAAASALAELTELGLMRIVAPPMEELRGVVCSDLPSDALTHSIAVVTALEQWWTALHSQPSGFPLSVPDLFADISPQLLQRYDTQVCDERTMLGLLKCAGFLHNIDRSQDGPASERQRGSSASRERVGAQMAAQLGQRWRLSKAESMLLGIVVGTHWQPAQLAQEPVLGRRAIYRYFREAGDHGIDAALVSLAHYVAAWEPSPSDPEWRRHAGIVIELLTAFFVKHATVISPPPLLSGTDILTLFGLSPGPLVGQLLARLRESQATGEVHTQEEAMAAVTDWLKLAPRLPGSSFSEGHQEPENSL